MRQRTQDTWGFWRKRKLDSDSNVQFGEGGAGTFSDGKLWSQVKDRRHLGRKVLKEFVIAGAPEEILTESRPHIGTFKLVTMVENMRAEIIRLGGEIRFEQKVESILRETDKEANGESDTEGHGQITGIKLLAVVKPCTAGILFSPLATAPATAFRCSMIRAFILKPSRSRLVFVLNIHSRPLTARALANRLGTLSWEPPNISWCITAKVAAVSTVSVCAPVAPWLPRPLKKVGLSPMACRNIHAMNAMPMPLSL